eukprot:4463797-Amphidinium_carterae.1
MSPLGTSQVAACTTVTSPLSPRVSPHKVCFHNTSTAQVHDENTEKNASGQRQHDRPPRGQKAAWEPLRAAGDKASGQKAAWR